MTDTSGQGDGNKTHRPVTGPWGCARGQQRSEGVWGAGYSGVGERQAQAPRSDAELHSGTEKASAKEPGASVAKTPTNQ